MATDSQRPLTFLSLPYEVTSLIYQHLFGTEVVLMNRWRPVWADNFRPHILNVCYKTRSGALRVLSELLTVHINAYSSLHADIPAYYLEHAAKLSISIHAKDADLSRFPKLECVELCDFKIKIREQLASAVDPTNTEEMKLFLKEVIETEIERQDPMKEWWAEEEDTWVDGVLAVGAALHLVVQIKGLCLGPLEVTFDFITKTVLGTRPCMVEDLSGWDSDDYSMNDEDFEVEEMEAEEEEEEYEDEDDEFDEFDL